MKKLSLVLVALVALVTVVVGCKPKNTPNQPETPVNTAIINNEKKNILSAEISHLEEFRNGNWEIHLYLSPDRKEKLTLSLDEEHHNDKTIDLTQKEPKHEGKYWSLIYHNPSPLILAFGNSKPVFTSGTLYVKTFQKDGKEGIEISIKGGKVKGLDKKEYTIDLNWKGLLDVSGIVIDDTQIVVKTVEIEAEALNEDKYLIKLYLSDDKNTVFGVQGNKETHDGKITDLTKVEAEPGSIPWCIFFIKNSRKLFAPAGITEDATCESGTLYIKRLPDDKDGNAVFDIEIRDLQVTDKKNGDGKTHTASVLLRGLKIKK